MAAGKEDLHLGTKEMKILHGLSMKCPPQFEHFGLSLWNWGSCNLRVKDMTGSHSMTICSSKWELTHRDAIRVGSHVLAFQVFTSQSPSTWPVICTMNHIITFFSTPISTSFSDMEKAYAKCTLRTWRIIPFPATHPDFEATLKPLVLENFYCAGFHTVSRVQLDPQVPLVDL